MNETYNPRDRVEQDLRGLNELAEHLEETAHETRAAELRNIQWGINMTLTEMLGCKALPDDMKVRVLLDIREAMFHFKGRLESLVENPKSAGLHDDAVE